MRRGKMRLVSALMSLMIMLILMSANSYAAGAYEPGRTGSIKIQLEDLGSNWEGSGFAIYQVGKVVSGKQLMFELTDDFKQTGIALNDLHYAAEQKEAAKACMASLPQTALSSASSNAQGNLTFPDLEQGVYLICQTERAEYGIVEPFLVFLPYMNETNDGWTYDITTSPKSDILHPKVGIIKVDEDGNALTGAVLALYDQEGKTSTTLK